MNTLLKTLKMYNMATTVLKLKPIAMGYEHIFLRFNSHLNFVCKNTIFTSSSFCNKIRLNFLYFETVMQISLLYFSRKYDLYDDNN